jgi:hypothetical protein
LAIRDKTVYVFGKPELPVGAVHIYVDVEGHLDQDFVYLIGMVICDGARQDIHSLWADRKQDEATIFNQFLEIVSRMSRVILEAMAFLRSQGGQARLATDDHARSAVWVRGFTTLWQSTRRLLDQSRTQNARLL